LPSLDLGNGAQSMLEEKITAARFEDPIDLRHRPSNLRDTAQRPGADHAVEGAVGERQFLSTKQPLIHLDAAPRDPPPSQTAHTGAGVDRGEPSDRLGVV